MVRFVTGILDQSEGSAEYVTDGMLAHRHRETVNQAAGIPANPFLSEAGKFDLPADRCINLSILFSPDFYCVAVIRTKNKTIEIFKNFAKHRKKGADKPREAKMINTNLVIKSQWRHNTTLATIDRQTLSREYS